MEKLELRVKALEGEVCKLEKRISRYRKIQTQLILGIEQLVTQLKDNNIIPIWTPDMLDIREEIE